MDSRMKHLSFDQLQVSVGKIEGIKPEHTSPSSSDIMLYISLVLENLCLTTLNNEYLICCMKNLKDWYRIRKLYKSKDVQWALRAKAVLDGLQPILAGRSRIY
ncbi:alpha-glucan water dikinase, chloroplast precursor, putative [Ricinus communis]|uniref:Alpha-glucan water dikinase, chloroplast, putative n=1 Tax=Ricinus communis TaxID=3988 RepID=B9RN09_RICCO|nr:alpha-glucan water dikinase, chloroplast precursor, putative [Ricinus communis]